MPTACARTFRPGVVASTQRSTSAKLKPVPKSNTKLRSESRNSALQLRAPSGRAELASAGELQHHEQLQDVQHPVLISTSQQAAEQGSSTLQRRGGGVSQQLAQHFDGVSQICALLAFCCVVAVLLPIVSDNAMHLARGNPAAIAEEAWQALLQDVFAFTGLTSVFVGLQEAGSGLVHWAAALLYTTFFLQLAMAGAVPLGMAAAVAAVAAVGMLMHTLKAVGWLEDRREGAWIWWTDILAILGWSLLPFLFTYNFMDSAQWGPSVAVGLLAAAWVAVKRRGGLHREVAAFWDRNGLALAATATFMMEGVSELAQLLESSHGYTPRQVMLNTGVVALLIPRALFTQDSMFFIDVTWNALLGWGQLLLLFSLRHTLSGAAHLSTPSFAMVSSSLAVLLVLCVRVTSRSEVMREAGGDSEKLEQGASESVKMSEPWWRPPARLVAFPFLQCGRFVQWLQPTRGAVLFRLRARRHASAWHKRRHKQLADNIMGKQL